MRVGVIGSGGREHAIVSLLAQDERVSELFVFPGNAGMEDVATCVDVDACDVEGVCESALELGIEFMVVTPDDPLALGMVDALEARGVPCFGPSAGAARLESSKAFAKELMRENGIPTADFCVLEAGDIEAALAYVEECELPCVVKASGLALGKGVLICETREDAVRAVRSMLLGDAFGESGQTIVVEQFLRGPEVSVLAFVDGAHVVPCVSAQDHKRAFDGDKGPNTGGMGTIAPVPAYTAEVARECMETIFEPTVQAMARRGTPFKGCLFFGLMLCEDGPRVLEYNVRFGDPETQVVLPLLESNLLDIMLAVRAGTLSARDVRFSNDSACCVVLASKGYPGAYDKGCELELCACEPGEYVFCAGVARASAGSGADASAGAGLVSAGGRVLDAVAVAPTLAEARERAYALAGRIKFDNGFMRTDIGAGALSTIDFRHGESVRKGGTATTSGFANEGGAGASTVAKVEAKTAQAEGERA